MAGLGQTYPDNTRTTSQRPATPHPDRHGHMPLGMSRCPVSEPHKGRHKNPNVAKHYIQEGEQPVFGADSRRAGDRV
jgi:hypothetical protein